MKADDTVLRTRLLDARLEFFGNNCVQNYGTTYML
jgi:hypothetical protein